MLIGGLKPRTVYWYRFSDRDGNGSRIGRTITAPVQSDQLPVRFALSRGRTRNPTFSLWRSVSSTKWKMLVLAPSNRMNANP